MKNIMKNIRKLSSTLFDAAGAVFVIPVIAVLFLGPVIIALAVWAVRLIKRARIKAQISRADEERKAQD